MKKLAARVITSRKLNGRAMKKILIAAFTASAFDEELGAYTPDFVKGVIEESGEYADSIPEKAKNRYLERICSFYSAEEIVWC